MEVVSLSASPAKTPAGGGDSRRHSATALSLDNGKIQSESA